MKKILFALVALMGCGGSPVLVSVDEEDAGGSGGGSEEVVIVPPVLEEVDSGVVVIEEDAGLPVEEEDAGVPVVEVDAGAPEWPGNSGNNNRCDAGQGKKLGLIKHGKCEPR